MKNFVCIDLCKYILRKVYSFTFEKCLLFKMNYQHRTMNLSVLFAKIIIIFCLVKSKI